MSLSPRTYRLAYWTVVRIKASGRCHLLGYRLPEGRGRYTSPMVSVDSASSTATTSTGNRYVLVGPASEEGLDDALVLHWLTLHDLARRDVEVVALDEA